MSRVKGQLPQPCGPVAIHDLQRTISEGSNPPSQASGAEAAEQGPRVLNHRGAHELGTRAE
eukprot:6531984-Alexandrium_andersonii.AAC.1